MRCFWHYLACRLYKQNLSSSFISCFFSSNAQDLWEKGVPFTAWGGDLFRVHAKKTPLPRHMLCRVFAACAHANRDCICVLLNRQNFPQQTLQHLTFYWSNVQMLGSMAPCLLHSSSMMPSDTLPTSVTLCTILSCFSLVCKKQSVKGVCMALVYCV